MKYSVVISELVNEQLKGHLIHVSGQEDLCFGLYSIGRGKNRITAILNEVILPEEGETNLHRNVSFNSEYFDRVLHESRLKKKGIVLLHSHPSKGWQGMSADDIAAEEMLSPRVKAASDLPLVGMTCGSDFLWSARFWNKIAPKKFERNWCETVRVVGDSFHITYNEQILPILDNHIELSRTVSAWGSVMQDKIRRLRVGIVGLGSVGSQIAEALMRTGVQNILLIDFDKVELKNLDRLPGINHDSIGKLKTEVYAALLNKNRLYKEQKIESVPFSIVEETGFLAAQDCDIIFCCVDRPWARFILNCIAYCYMIPVIDGGISASFNRKANNIGEARWRAYVAGPHRRCMKCMGQYKPEDVSLEQTGLLEDPSYIKNLPPQHFIHKGENVYSFSIGLASLEMQHFLSLVLHPKSVVYGPKEMDFITGNIDFKFPYNCDKNCEMNELLGIGDKIKSLLIQCHVKDECCRKE